MGKIRFALFKYFLKVFCEKELDQWERWKIKTKYGDVFVSISRERDRYRYEDFK